MSRKQLRVNLASLPQASKKGGRPPFQLGIMLRIYLQHKWYSLSDLAIEVALLDVPTMRRITDIKLISDRIPDDSTIPSSATCSRSKGWASRSLRPSGAPQCTWHYDATRHDRRCHLDCSTQLHQEQGGKAGCGDAPDQKGQPVVFRDKSPRQCRQGFWPDPFISRHGRQLS